MQDILKLTEVTSYNRVKTEILEKKEEYVKSLQMLLSTVQQGPLSASNGQYILHWVETKLRLLEDRASLSPFNKTTFEGFKREVT